MNEIEKLERENKALSDQLAETQELLAESQLVFRQIIDFSSKLAVTIELQEIYRNCLNLFKNLMQLDFATLFLVLEDQDTCVVCDTIGFPQSMVGNFKVHKGLGLPGRVLESRQLEIVEDFATEKRFAIPDIISENNIRSAIATPMMLDNEIFGVIIGHSVDKVIFTEGEKSLAQIFANQSATAIKNITHIQSLVISEQNLKQRTNEFETIFANTMAGIMLLQGGRVLARCNQRLADFMGYDSPEDLKGMGMQKFHLSEERFLEFGQKYYNSLVSGELVQVEYQLRKKDGQPLWCILSGKAIDPHFPPDLDKGVVWMIDDISQRKKMEEQLLKTSKLESLEILAGGLAHDFNNIITVILGNISLGMETIDAETPGYSFLSPAEKATLRAKDLTQKLLTFSKGGAPVRSLASFVEIIQDSVDFALSGSSVKVQYQFDTDLWQGNIDKVQISQVMQNLIMNSKKAMPDGGNIAISAINFDHTDEVSEIKAGNYVKIVISDTGYGIAPEIIGKVFDPYFTTRNFASTKGCGLGLSIVHSIISRHEGAISVESTENSGTSFTIYIPASSEISPVEQQEPPSATVEGKGRVLVMDDEACIRELLSQMLSLRGYEVEEAVDGEQAVALYHANLNTDKAFNVVLMDLTIPGGMGGEEAVQKVLAIDQNAKVIVASGYSDDPIMSHYADYGFTASIKKPFSLSQLHEVIHATLVL